MQLLRPRAIRVDDVTEGFDSGEVSLDRYLTDRALSNHLPGNARCYVTVARESGRVVGYYTISAISVMHAELPGRVRRNAPNPVPAVLIGRLAVDREVQGQGLGRHLLRDAVRSTLAAADVIGVRILVVHALHERAATFYASAGFAASPTDPLHLHVLLADARASLPES